VLEFLYSIDVAIFFFINHTIVNPVFDVLLPFLTDMNKIKVVQIIVLAFVLWIIIKGNRTSRTVIGLLILTIIVSDQLSSTFIKPFVGRIRPCKVLHGVRMLVDCGPGLSFPSSHAVNNFAGATVISSFYKKQKWFWYGLAFLVALSRPYVGVHYPSDILAGGIIGFTVAFIIVALWKFLDQHFFASKSL
jgi:undecaprenyl-diphosphatase